MMNIPGWTVQPFTRDPDEARAEVMEWYYQLATKEGRQGHPEAVVAFRGRGFAVWAPKPASQEAPDPHTVETVDYFGTPTVFGEIAPDRTPYGAHVTGLRERGNNPKGLPRGRKRSAD